MHIMATASDDLLALQRLYHWEKTAASRMVFTQPYDGAAKGSGQVRTWTWKQAVDETRRMAAYLKGLNLPPKSNIALISKNCAHWLMTDWAIWMAGHVSVPLYPTLAAETIRQILEHSQSQLLFVGKLDGWDGMKAGVPAGLPCISYPLSPPNNFPTWDDIVAKTAPMTASPTRPADEMATIIYTSGTTGMPKGVMHNFGGFARALAAGLTRTPINEQSRMLSYLPLSHIVERCLVEHGLLATGMQLYFAESLDTFTTDLQRAQPTTFFSVPRLWVKFQQGVSKKMPPAKLNRLLKIPILSGIVRKKVLTALGLDKCTWAAGGAAPMPPDLLTWYAKLGLPLVEGYGMTENFGASHSTIAGKPRPGTVGIPYPGLQSRFDPGNGEIQVKCDWMMMGYYKEPELTKAAFTDDGWLHTGDKGALDAEGNLKITGRVKDLFKTSKGKYVAPAPIEDRLVMHDAVEAVAVSGANLGQPLGLVMLNPDGMAKAANATGRSELEASLAQHLEAVNAKLDPHEQMDCLIVVKEPWTVDNGFITPTFKIKRNKIDEAYAAQFEAWSRARKKVVWQS
jgi:long-chain acyl-CoA synthetase